MKNNELPKATEKEFAKRAELASRLNENPNDELNMENLKFLNSYRWDPEILEENGKVGLQDILGNLMVPALFDDLLFMPAMVKYHKVVAAQINGKWGLVANDGSGRYITNFDYDWIAPIAGPLVIVKKNGKWGYLEHSGVPFGKIEYDSIYVDRNGYSFVNGYSVFTKNPLWGITDGENITKAEFDEIEYFDLDNWVKVVKDGVYGFIDQNGKFTIDEEEANWYAGF